MQEEQAELEQIKKKDLRAAKFEEFEAAKAERHAAYEEMRAKIVAPEIPEWAQPLLD